MADCDRIYIDKKNIKLIALSNDMHMEIEFDHRRMNELHKNGWRIYATNDEGVFFFLNNCQDDGKDWCKISKR